MALNSYSGVLDAFKNLKVLIIGDAMIDTYSFGEITRISPEAPVPVVRIHRKEDRSGGAANVALNIHALRAVPLLCSVIGADQAGDTLVSLLEDVGFDTRFLIRSASRQTTVKHRVIAKGGQLMRLDYEDEHPLNELESAQLLQNISEVIGEVDVVLIQDYEKGVLFPAMIHEILIICEENGKSVCVDPKKKNFGCYAGVKLLKPNLKELLEFVGEESQHWQSAAAQVQNQLCENLLLTLAAEGIYYQNSKISGHVTGRKREVSDVSGAGDTVIAVAALCVGVGLPLEQVAILANHAGGIVCESQGVVPVSYDKLLEEVSELTF